VTQDSPILTIRDLTFSRADEPLFDRLDFCVRVRSAVRLTGPNGIGKTTLLRILAGLIRPEKGEVLFRGEPIATLREDYAKELLYIGHKESLEPSLNVAENLGFALLLDGVSATHTELTSALNRFGLSHALNRSVAELSAGQKRKVALCRLLFSRKPLWFLDEPCTALDVDSIALLSTLIAEHVKSGGTLVYTTHQPLELALEPGQSSSFDLLEYSRSER